MGKLKKPGRELRDAVTGKAPPPPRPLPLQGIRIYTPRLSPNPLAPLPRPKGWPR